MRKAVFSSIAGAALALAASSASAQLVLDFKWPPAQTVNVTAPAIAFNNVAEQAGEFTGTFNGQSFLAFCSELTQNFVPGQVYNDYVLDSAAAAGWTGARLNALNHAMSYFLGAGAPTDPTSSALAQSAIWEILYENTGTYSFASGDMIITGAGLNDSIFASLMAAPVTYQVARLHSTSNQDFIVATPVPEPSTYALMLAGLAGIGFVARRRAQR